MRRIAVLLLSFVTTTALAEVAVDGRFKGTIAGVADGGRDFGIADGRDRQQGYIDLSPWVHFQFGTHWGMLFRPEGYAQTGQLLRPGNESNNVQTAQDSGNSKYGFVGVKEAWIEYAGLTDYPGEFFRVGRQRIRQDDGEWWDTDIEAARWVLDTTQFQTELGAAHAFGTYRSDDAPVPKSNRYRTYLFGSIGGEWIERNRITLRAVYAKDRDKSLPDTGETPNPNNKLERANLAWVGVQAHDHYFDWKRPPHFGYWAQAMGLVGRDRNSNIDTTPGPTPSDPPISTIGTPAFTDTQVRAWATEAGLKICMPRRWPIQFGGLFAYSTGAKGTDGSGDPDRSQQFFQTGVESNYSRFTGTRTLIHRFNEAYRAELGNLQAATAFMSLDAGHYDTSLVFNQFWKAHGRAPIQSDGITAQPLNTARTLGRGYDVIFTRYFSIRSEDALEDPEGQAESSAIRLRGSVFEPGVAYEDATHKPHPEYRAVLELVLWY